MSRSTIIAGKAVILVSLEDNIGKGLSAIQSKLGRLSNTLNNMGGTALRGGFLGALASGKIAKDFTTFEDSILFLSTKLESFTKDLQLNGQETEFLTKKIIKLSRAMGELPVEVSKAAIALAAANFTPKGIDASLQGVINLAKGTNYGLDDSANLIANLASTFKLLGEDQSAAQQLTNINTLVSQLVKATNLGTIGIEDLRESLKFVSGNAAELGVKLPVILGFLAGIGDSGLKASLGGTSLNIVLQRLATNLGKIKKAIPGFNLTFNPDGSLDLAATMNDLLKKTEKLSKIKRITLFHDIFNVRGQRAVLASDIEKIIEHIEKLNEVTDLAVKAQERMNSGLGGVWRRLVSEVAIAEIAIGTGLQKEFKALGEIVTITIHALAGFAIKFKEVTLAILLAPIALSVFAVGAFTLSFALSRLVSVLGMLKSGLSGISSIAKFGIGSATNTLSMLTSPSKASKVRLRNIQKETTLIARIKAVQAKSLAGGSSPDKVATSKNTAKLVAAEARLDILKPKRNFGDKLRAGGNKILGVGDRIEAIYKEKKEIKAQIALEKEASVAARKSFKDRVGLNKNVDSNLKNRSALASKLETQAAAHRKRASLLGTLLESEEKKDLRRSMRAAKVQPALNHMIEKSYDELYKTRQQLKDVPQMMKGPGGGIQFSQQHIALKTKEAKLASFINTQQANQVKVAWRLNASKKYQANIVAQIAKNEKVAGAYDAKRIRVAKQAGLAEKINVAATAKRAKLAANFEKANLVRSARMARAAKILQGTSYFTGMGKGIASLFKGLSIDKSLIGITKLGFSFLKLSGSLLKFAFSWNAVGMIFNILLLFGHKIPVVANAFKALGQGLSAAFGELGKIATYAAPAMDLFKLSFQAFSSGESELGMKALGAAISGVADIITNQLSAAWSAFMVKVGYITVFFKQLGLGIWFSLSAIFDGLGALAGGIMSTLSSMLDPLLNLNTGITSNIGEAIAVTFNNAITEFFKWGSWFIEQWNQSFIELGRILATFIGYLPGGAKSANSMEKSMRTKEIILGHETAARNLELEKGRLEREVKIKAAMKEKADPDKAAIDAQWRNIDSQIAAGRMEQIWRKMMNDIEAAGKAEQPGKPDAEKKKAAVSSNFGEILSALVGSVEQTRGEYFKVDAASALEVAIEQRDLLKDIKNGVANLEGGVG